MTDTARTGHPQIDAALAALAPLEELPPEEHVAVYESVHAALRAALSGGPAAPAS